VKGAPVRPPVVPEQTELSFDGSADLFSPTRTPRGRTGRGYPDFQRRHIRIRCDAFCRRYGRYPEIDFTTLRGLRPGRRGNSVVGPSAESFPR